jgi:hypothetical protein
MINSKEVDSCTELLKTMEILPFFSRYIFFLLLYVLNNKHLFPKHSAVHNNDIRSANIFHLHFTNLTKYHIHARKRIFCLIICLLIATVNF